MNYRKLGTTDLTVSEVAVGCSGYWGNRRFPERDAEAVIQEAFARGVNYFDTGHNYCNYYAEPRLGRILKGLFAAHDRSKFVIASKAGTVSPSAPMFYRRQRSTKNYSPDYIEAACTKSIHNLNCEYLDLFQLHGITEAELSPALVERLVSMKARGMFRYLGVNTHNEPVMCFVARHPELFDMVLLDYNVLQLDRDPIISSLAQAGIGVVAGTVLAQGHLVSGKIGSLKSFADVWYLARAIGKPAGRVLAQNSKGMREALASVSGATPAQAAFAFALRNQQISSCVFGTTKVANLIEVIDATNITLNNEAIVLVQQAYAALSDKLNA